ncbi:MAG: RsmB/NOP family class I SAM-dependent RNA methyltransferase [Flavobacteriales bacterium]
MARERDRRGAAPPIAVPPHVAALLGEEAPALLAALEGPSPISIRLNRRKPVPDRGSPVPWCGMGRYLLERPVFTLDPLLHAGCYYVQEASSMLLEQAVHAAGPWPADTVALDLCAAPGGKSTHIADLLPEEALLICNEPVRPRQAALQENLLKWGRTGTVITGARPEAFLPLGAFADLIVVDAPCSGEGMFRKEPFARTQWNDGLVEHCALQQRAILEVAWELLRPGGTVDLQHLHLGGTGERTAGAAADRQGRTADPAADRSRMGRGGRRTRLPVLSPSPRGGRVLHRRCMQARRTEAASPRPGHRAIPGTGRMVLPA